MTYVTDFLILMLVDVLTPGEMYYFSFSTLRLPYETLRQCMKRGDYRTAIFKLLSDSAKRMNLSVDALRMKFERFDFGTSVLFNNHKGRFGHVSETLMIYQIIIICIISIQCHDSLTASNEIIHNVCIQ